MEAKLWYELMVQPSELSLSFLLRERKTHKHKQICGIAPGLGGSQRFVDVFFSGHSL